MVILNKIYTRTGDDGTTALGSGERRKKYDLRIAAYGTLDETNAALLTTTTLVFGNPPTTYQVNGVGPALPYTSGADIDINGWRVQGTSRLGDGDLIGVGTVLMRYSGTPDAEPSQPSSSGHHEEERPPAEPAASLGVAVFECRL